MEMGKQVPMTLWIDDHPSTAGCLRQILEQPVAAASSKGQPRKGLTIGRYKRPDDLGNRWILENLRFFFRNGKSQFVVHWESRPSAFWPGKSICPSAGHLQWPTGLVAPLVMPAVSGVGDKEVIKR
jgi:hypothetical protein